MIPNKVVAHFRDGHVVKGSTDDFVPAKGHFHVTEPGDGVKPASVDLADLKALFFVKDLVGKGHHDKLDFDPARPILGRKIQVTFTDGEVFVGTTQGYWRGRTGFFVTPADPESNIDRCFVVTSSTKDIHFL